MPGDDDEEVETRVGIAREALRPFAQAFVRLPEEVQAQLGATHGVLITHLRDAWFAFERLTGSDKP